MRVKPSTCALLFALCLPLSVSAALPEAGMSMKAVEARFGPALRKDAAVGSPPITRWEYSDSVVVFEGSTVVHSMSVQRSSSPTPAATLPAPTASSTPVTRPAPTTVVRPTPPAAKPSVPAAAPLPAARTTAEADAMTKATAEKSAARPADPATAAPVATPDTAAPAPANENYTFDPETGRIIVK